MKKWFDGVKPGTILIYACVFLLSSLLFGTLLRYLIESLSVIGGSARFRWRLLIEPATWGVGALVTAMLGALYALNGGFQGALGGALLGGKDGESSRVEGSLENSRFLTEQERDKYFPTFTYETITESKNDGVPARAVLNKKGKLEGNWKSGVHALVIGATGSGKTTTFINPMIQCIAAANLGSSMIMTDPKGELFDLHSGFLKRQGYEVMVLDLRDTYSSSRWNPLEPIWDAWQESVHLGRNLVMHIDSMDKYPDLRRLDGDAKAGEPWVECNGAAYAGMGHCKDDVELAKNKIFDEMYEDLQDLVGGLVPITNEKDQMWESGARAEIRSAPTIISGSLTAARFRPGTAPLIWQ